MIKCPETGEGASKGPWVTIGAAEEEKWTRAPLDDSEKPSPETRTPAMAMELVKVLILANSPVKTEEGGRGGAIEGPRCRRWRGRT